MLTSFFSKLLCDPQTNLQRRPRRRTHPCGGLNFWCRLMVRASACWAMDLLIGSWSFAKWRRRAGRWTHSSAGFSSHARGSTLGAGGLDISASETTGLKSKERTLCWDTEFRVANIYRQKTDHFYDSQMLLSQILPEKPGSNWETVRRCGRSIVFVCVGCTCWAWHWHSTGVPFGRVRGRWCWWWRCRQCGHVMYLFDVESRASEVQEVRKSCDTMELW